MKISTDEKYNNLEAWTPDPSMECDIDGDLGEGGATKMGGSGWAAEDMFKKNANEFGVKSDYDATLTGYTVQLEKDQVSDYSKRRADALASQIESQVRKELVENPTYVIYSKANYGVHLQHELDENMDEESKFSAVDESKTNNDRPSKYVPPSRRQPEPVKMNGSQQQAAPKQQQSTSRQNSRNNSESERNKGQVSQKPAQAKSPTTPTPPPMLSTKAGVEKKETKKQNNPRASPTTDHNKTTRNNQVGIGSVELKHLNLF